MTVAPTVVIVVAVTVVVTVSVTCIVVAVVNDNSLPPLLPPTHLPLTIH